MLNLSPARKLHGFFASFTLLLVAALISLAVPAAPAAKSGDEVNPYPETPEEIAAYKEHLTEKYHEQICNYPEEAVEISTLKELFEYAAKSGVHVKMEPGVYEIGVDNCEELWEGGKYLLEFSGIHSFYDLRGVEMRIDSVLQPTHSFKEEVGISGDHLIMQGLTVTMVGNYPHRDLSSTPIGGTFGQKGDNNLIQGVTINSRGSYPYGYQTALHVYKKWNFSNVPKRRAVAATGQNNVYMDVDIYHRGNGHALSWAGDVAHTWIDCDIQGKVRLSDDILKNTGGGFYDDPSALPKNFDLSEHLSSGKIIPLCEDAFRSYGGGKRLKVLGCTIKSLRDAFKRGSYETVFLSHVTVRGVRNGPFLTAGSQMTRIVNCKVGMLCGYIMRRLSDGAEVDITLLPPDPGILPSHSEKTKRQAIRRFISRKKRSGWITGDQSEVVLRAGKGLNMDKLKSRAPFVVDGKDIYLRNETTLPVKLSHDSRNCKIITRSEVTDNGQENEIKYIE